MVPFGGMQGGHVDTTSPAEVRAVVVPTRVLGDGLIVARPSDGTPVVLPATASAVLAAADDWCSLHDLDAALRRAFPNVEPDERRRVLAALVRDLASEGLLERR